MYPHERSLVDEMKDQPFALIGVNSDDLERAKKAVADNKLNWRSFQNEPSGAKRAISADWYVSGWPTIVVLDAEMKIRYRGHDGHEASDIAKKLVAEMKASK
ncbi:MAG: redoxin domain-containing protein [Planctomycetes bacterium]|nr:redoxin domain-containing protein [Planctomycetota bacterium]